jgi:hypothetical protein
VRRKILALAALFALALSVSAQSTLQPLDHPVYNFLDRMEALGLVDHSLLGSKPVTRLHIAILLDEVQAKRATDPSLLSPVDTHTLAAFRWEFHRDLVREGKTTPDAPYPDGRSRFGRFNDWMHDRGLFTDVFYGDGLHFYSYETDAFDAYVDPYGSSRLIRQKGDDRSIVITAAGLRLRAHLPHGVGIYFDFQDYVEQGRGPYWSRMQLYQDRYGFVGAPKGSSSINYDVANFDLALGGSFWELHAAKMPLRWGPGRSGQFLLSDWGTSFHQFQAAFNLGRQIRFVYVFGSLSNFEEIADTLYMSAGYYRLIRAQKYIAAHRLEWDLHPRLNIAFSEAVVFGERPPRLPYLIPVNFFYSAQHDQQDEDNTLMCFDLSWLPYRHWRLYGQLLIDDMTFGKVFSDYYGNKVGYLAGANNVQPFGLKNFDATLEYVHLRPYIYTHHYPVNAYSHWDAPLGYRYPPNSQVVFGEIRFRPHRRVNLAASLTHLMHGANTDSVNAGGSIFMPFVRDSQESAPFLGGKLERSDVYGLEGTFEVLENLYLWGRSSYLTSNNQDNLWEWEVGFRLN